MRILLITGWGGGIKLLSSLQQALQNKNYDVELINIFNAFDPDVLQQQVELAHAFDVIIGWSLGGQLAAVLVDQIEQQFGEKKVLITLASNPCFVAQNEWHAAMSQANFHSFKKSFELDATATLKKFGYMICQGVESTKVDFVNLQSLIQPQKNNLLQQGLVLLEKLNVVDILRTYSGSQYHIFAEQDMLVDCKVIQNFSKLDAKFLQYDLIQGSHGFPVFKSEVITDKIFHYLQKIKER